MAERDLSVYKRFLDTGDEDWFVVFERDLGDDSSLTWRGFRIPRAGVRLMLMAMLTEARIELTYGSR